MNKPIVLKSLVTRKGRLHTRLPLPNDAPVAATVELNSNNCFSHQGLKMRFSGVGHRPSAEDPIGAGGDCQDGGPGRAGVGNRAARKAELEALMAAKSD